MYGRDAVLPIEFAISTSQNECPTEHCSDDLLKRVHTLTGKVIGDRLETQDVIHKAQEKQILRHDDNLQKVVRFKIGDPVLLYQSQLRGKRKLEDRWKGPYYIHEVLENGAYKLRTAEDKILKVPVNSERLKHYHQRSPN